MKRIKYTGSKPENIDTFPKGAERSVKGSMHLLPNSIKNVTDDEFEYLKSLEGLHIYEVPKARPPVAKLEVLKGEPKKIESDEKVENEVQNEKSVKAFEKKLKPKRKRKN